ncbi:hypothetical protein FPSE_04147 [Fusarium pseudograminearum CS3096]|uniref:Uncharacterized protein n=1 Tax=Fusarium pseudograminearum (strain CS3096) TaxID=1028729 RepID=K3UT17_FUSPC|nr:hypothetical protein FPSE_04147 [Fusarium pseudograminearum CS3096]EKJ75646.1 hypothetical protein FPSE_04147 [Fusarium pseudograminearum CS3096]
MQKLTVDLEGQYNLASASPEFLTLAHFEVQCYIHSAPMQWAMNGNAVASVVFEQNVIYRLELPTATDAGFYESCLTLLCSNRDKDEEDQLRFVICHLPMLL